jgi:hypothetical protein
MERWNPRRQGDIGELSAINWLIGAGAVVSMPMFHSPDYDLVADFGDRPLRVQVKTSGSWHKGRFVVALCTRGGNQSWNGVVKRLDSTRCDHLFVHLETAGGGSSPHPHWVEAPESCWEVRSTRSTRSSPVSRSQRGAHR